MKDPLTSERSPRGSKRYGFLLPGLALGGALILLFPGQESAGFSKIGGLLSQSQRDFRVFNNFADSQTNNNTTPDPQFPGWDGAEMAIWKACIEWQSEPHGNGSGDPLQSVLGSGGANFDPLWSGTAAGVGGTDHNVHSAVTSCSGGVLAFTETPINNGWRIRYCDNWTWHDGPGDNPGGFDLQGVACHEYGHALGLGHSGSGGATMFPSTSGSGSSNQRSINSDDVAGIQCVYGVKLAGFKPVIQSVSVSGSTVTITGQNFSLSGGEVWFTNKNVTQIDENPRVRLTGVVATSGGTQIQVTIPPDAGRGDVIVKRGLSGNNSISNAFPFDGEGQGTPLTVTNVTPATIENLIPGTAETITVTGTGFTAGSTVEIDGTPIAGSSTTSGTTTITFEWEPVGSLGSKTLTVRESGQTASMGIDVVANAATTLQAGNGDAGNVVSGSAPITMGGQVGDLHYVLLSPSNVPSVLPGQIMLDMGNFFSSLFEVGFYFVGSNGIVTDTVPLTGVVGTTLYWQSLNVKLPLASSYPLESSNLQSTFTP